MGELGFNAPHLVRRGYDTGQVNAFVRRIDDTLHGGTERPVTARDLVTAKFRRVTPLARGYACPDVDAFLFDVAPSVIRANSARRAVFAAGAADAFRTDAFRTDAFRTDAFPTNVFPTDVFPTDVFPTDVFPTAASPPRRLLSRNWLGRLVNRTD
jgi:hypothetical protein